MATDVQSLDSHVKGSYRNWFLDTPSLHKQENILSYPSNLWKDSSNRIN